MTELQVVILVALGLLFVLCVVVSMTLRHYIGGFLENVAREEEESREEAEARERQASDPRQENKP